jgi:hypothetical protein
LAVCRTSKRSSLSCPKVKLHVHLIGSAPVDTVLELALRHPDSGVPRTAEGLREFYEFSDFPHFINVYKTVSKLVREPEDIADLVRGIGRELGAQHVRYVELQVAPYPFLRAGMPATVITEALDAGARDVLSGHGVRIGYIFDFPGHSAGEDAVPALEHALTAPPRALVGLGIGGIEAGRAPYTEVIRDVFGAAADCRPPTWRALRTTRCGRRSLTRGRRTRCLARSRRCSPGRVRRRVPGRVRCSDLSRVRVASVYARTRDKSGCGQNPGSTPI